MLITKKLLLLTSILISLFFIFGLIYAENFNNLSKDYNSTSKTITLENDSDVISEITLNTPLIYNVIRGKDSLVAEYTINNYFTASDIIGIIEFYDLKKNKSVYRDFTYKKKIISFADVLNYDKVCFEEVNKSISCNLVINGTRKKESVNWVNFDEKSTLTKENITIGIFTDVYADEMIEWIPTIYNIEIFEWAIWTEALSVGLVHWWEANSSEGKIVDLVGLNNGTLEEGTLIKTGDAHTDNKEYIKFDGADDFVDFGNIIDFPTATENFTILLGINKSVSGDSYEGIFTKGLADTELMMTTGTTADNGDIIGWVETSSALTSPVGALPNNNWVDLVWKRNDSGEYMYVSGVLVDEVIPSARDLTEAGDFHLGSRPIVNNFTGSMYKIAIWNNRSLSDNEILYVNTSYFADLNPPSINITHPINNTNWTIIDVNVNYTALDPNIDSCWYSNSSGEFNISLADCGTNITGVSWIQGINNVTIWVNDSSDNNNHSDISFFIDTINPSIIINSPAVTITSASMNINITATDTNGILNCTYNITRGGATEKATTSINLVNFTEPYTLSGAGTYNVWVFCNDTFNLQNITNRTFTYSLPVLGGGGGGGSPILQIIEDIIPEITADAICEPLDVTLLEVYNQFRAGEVGFFELFKRFFDSILCRSASSIVSFGVT